MRPCCGLGVLVMLRFRERNPQRTYISLARSMGLA